jgi:hypothetical protein
LSASAAANSPDGAFTLNVRPGRYYIVPLCFVACYPVSVLISGQEVLGKPVDLVSSAQSIHVVYKAATGTARVMVDNPSSTVVLVPEQIGALGFGHMGRTGADGSLNLTALIPGSYMAAAFTGLSPTGRLDSEVLEKTLSIGARIRIEEGSPASVSLTAVPWLQ